MAPRGPAAFYFYHNSYNEELFFFFFLEKVILAQVALAFSLFKEIDFYYFQAQMCLCVSLCTCRVQVSSGVRGQTLDPLETGELQAY